MWRILNSAFVIFCEQKSLLIHLIVHLFKEGLCQTKKCKFVLKKNCQIVAMSHATFRGKSFFFRIEFEFIHSLVAASLWLSLVQQKLVILFIQSSCDSDKQLQMENEFFLLESKIYWSNWEFKNNHHGSRIDLLCFLYLNISIRRLVSFHQTNLFNRSEWVNEFWRFLYL